jgi:DNA mismatch repair protein MutL
MAAPIVLLPDTVINQIAAGEVIERPASVVKELVENSIDAGAAQVTVELEQGGSRLIRVHDDGSGIPRDELALALRRHATSKLRDLDDLSRLQTLGFRGEALPSIGSISQLRLTSRVGDDETAWSVSMSGADRISAAQPAAHGPGTTVEVRELFYCVPARRRFLKTERTEFLHVQDWLRRTALARPQVDLVLNHNGQRVFAVRAARSSAELPLRVEKIAGAAFMRHARRVDASAEGLALHGWIVPADAARNQSDLQYWLVNGRPVRDGRLLHAVRLAYENTLPEGRHPAFVLYLQIDPAVLDVNVHPAKTEVRFADPLRVHDFIFSALRRALQEAASAASEQPSTQAAAARVAESVGSYRGPVRPVHRPAPLPPASKVDTGGWQAEYLAFVEGALMLARCDGRVWLFDGVEAQLAVWSVNDRIESKPLMFPQSILVSPAMHARVSSNQPLLSSLGLELEPAAGQLLLVRAVPEALGQSVERSVSAMLALLDPAADTGPDRRATARNALARVAASALSTHPDRCRQLLARLAQHFELQQLAMAGIARCLDDQTLRRLLKPDE